MEKQLTRLVRPPVSDRYPDDVRAIRAILNRHGFDADPRDIEWAYGLLSEDRYCASWLVLDFFREDILVKHLQEYLVPDAPTAP